MTEKELIEAINGLDIKGVKATTAMKMEELQTLHGLLTAPKNDSDAAKQLESANARIAELEEANAALEASAAELSKALAESESKAPVKEGVKVKHEGKTYLVKRGGAIAIEGERVVYTPEDLQNNEELVAHLVKIGALKLISSN